MADTRPNIVFILTDQQRYDTIAALGYPYMETPNLDRLVREGTTFTNCFITAPSCVPSRCSVFNGCYPHTTGVYKNGDRWTESWVSDLARAGYRCVNVGKMHTVPLTTPLGFHERYVVENKDRFLEGRYFFDEWDKALRARGLVKQQRALYRQRDDYRQRLGAFTWDLDEDMQSDNFVGEMAKWWLDTYPLDQPLFMEIGFPGPHPPYDPTPRWLEHYLDKDLPIREPSETDLAGQPSPMKALRRHMLDIDHDSVVHLANPTKEQRHYQRACYLANVSMIDEQIGAVMDSLQAQGLLDNTAIVFASDHGDCLGDHGHSQKWSMFEEIVRMPAVVWFGEKLRAQVAGGRAAALAAGSGSAAGSSGTGGRAGQSVDGLVSLMDLGPTMLELAGIEPPAAMEAVSLLPLIQGRPLLTPAAPPAPDTDAALPETDRAVAKSDANWDLAPPPPAFVGSDGRDYVFAEHGRDNTLDTVDTMTMVRDSRWKMVVFAGTDEGQLYDLVEDPGEETNLFRAPAHRAKKQELTQVLMAWYQDSLYRTRSRRR
jgi:arylsulfatase A-like enzyme